MRHFATIFVATMAAAIVHAQSLPTLMARPKDTYIFDQPRVVMEQRLFGFAHGVSLLAHACLAQPGFEAPVRKAYASWHERQFPTIDRARQELAVFYFGKQATTASWSDIVSAIGLKSELPLKPGTKQFDAACASFPAALNSYRNDLAAQFRLQADLTRVTVGTVTIAHVDACLGQMDSEPAAQLRTRSDAWHGQYDAGIAQSRQGLEQQWKIADMDGSIERLLQQARDEGARQAGKADCAAMANWLASPAADPDTAFKAKQ